MRLPASQEPNRRSCFPDPQGIGLEVFPLGQPKLLISHTREDFQCHGRKALRHLFPKSVRKNAGHRETVRHTIDNGGRSPSACSPRRPRATALHSLGLRADLGFLSPFARASYIRQVPGLWTDRHFKPGARHRRASAGPEVQPYQPLHPTAPTFDYTRRVASRRLAPKPHNLSTGQHGKSWPG